MKKILLLSMMVTLSLLAAKNIHYSSTYQKCLDQSGGVTTEMRMCNTQELKYQDKLLNQNYQKAMQRVEKEKRDEFKKVQRLWIKYRDARCDFLFGLTGGTIDLLNGDSCLIDMTVQRAGELKAINNFD